MHQPERGVSVDRAHKSQEQSGLRTRLADVRAGEPVRSGANLPVGGQIAGTQALSESIAREAAYLDGLSDAISAIEQNSDEERGLMSEPVFKALLKERRGCFAAGIGCSMIVAGLAIAAASAGLVALAVVQFALLGIGFVAVLFARDPFKLDRNATARENAAWKRDIEERLKSLDKNVQARSKVVEQLTEGIRSNGERI